MNVLIVDDSKTARFLLMNAMKELGYTDFFDCDDIIDAKKILEQEVIDLIFSDWHMPNGSGLDLLKFIRATPAYAKIPFLMVTTEQHKQNILEAVKVGIQGYFFKPIQKDALKSKLFELIKANCIKAPAA
jgi:two-component system chemotaxis response regulator CheY